MVLFIQLSKTAIYEWFSETLECSYIPQVSPKSSVPPNFDYVLHSHFHVILSFFTPCLKWFTTCHLGCDSAHQTEETFVQVTTYALIICVYKEMNYINYLKR